MRNLTCRQFLSLVGQGFTADAYRDHRGLRLCEGCANRTATWPRPGTGRRDDRGVHGRPHAAIAVCVNTVLAGGPFRPEANLRCGLPGL
jgi:hypothetical protein